MKKTIKGLKVLLLSATLISTQCVNVVSAQTVNAPNIAQQLAYGTYKTFANIEGSRNGSYLYHYPAGVNKATTEVPLVIYLHGDREKSTTAAWVTGLVAKADAEKFAVAFLDAEYSVNMPTFDIANITTFTSNVNWVLNGSETEFQRRFISMTIDRAVDDDNIDPFKVYLIGNSRGAFVTYDMIPLLQNKIAAFGTHVGQLPQDVLANELIPPGGIAPIMVINGTNDLALNYTVPNAAPAPRLSYNVEDGITELKRYNRTTSQFSIPSIINTNATDGCTVLRYTVSNADNLETVRFFKINGGGHLWAGTNANTAQIDNGLAALGIGSIAGILGPLCKDINATNEYWNFFKTKTLDCQNIPISFTVFPYLSGTYFRAPTGNVIRQGNTAGTNKNFGVKCPANWKSLEFDEEISSLNDNLYPNPSSDFVYLDIKKEEIQEVKIYDFKGQQIDAKIDFEEMDNSTMFNISVLPAGSYIVRIYTGDQVLNKKMVKQ